MVYTVNYFIFAAQREENVALGRASAYSAKKMFNYYNYLRYGEKTFNRG